MLNIVVSDVFEVMKQVSFLVGRRPHFEKGGCSRSYCGGGRDTQMRSFTMRNLFLQEQTGMRHPRTTVPRKRCRSWRAFSFVHQTKTDQKLGSSVPYICGRPRNLIFLFSQCFWKVMQPPGVYCRRCKNNDCIDVFIMCVLYLNILYLVL